MQRAPASVSPLRSTAPTSFVANSARAVPLEKTPEGDANNWQFLRTVTSESEPITQAKCMSEGVLTQAEGQSLIGSAQAVIAELGG
jgi:hypothetical protein